MSSRCRGDKMTGVRWGPNRSLVTCGSFDGAEKYCDYFFILKFLYIKSGI